MGIAYCQWGKEHGTLLKETQKNGHFGRSGLIMLKGIPDCISPELLKVLHEMGPALDRIP